MKLTLLRKSAGSSREDDCPAMYAAANLVTMAAQGIRLDPETAAQLLHRAEDEDGVLLPTETVLRSVAEFIAQQGDPDLAAAIEAFVLAWEHRLEQERSGA